MEFKREKFICLFVYKYLLSTSPMIWICSNLLFFNWSIFYLQFHVGFRCTAQWFKCFFIFFPPHRLLQNIECSSLCYAVDPVGYLFHVWQCVYAKPILLVYLSLTPSSLVTKNLFSMEGLFLFCIYFSSFVLLFQIPHVSDIIYLSLSDTGW